MAERPLEGKVALVTGGSSGIGEATARLLADAGATIAINSARSVEAGERVAAELPGGIYVQGDVASVDDARAIVAATTEQLGRLDILVNNAGATVLIPHHDLDAVTPEVWHQILDVNVIGTWNVTQAAVPHLRESGEGCIVNVTSVAGLRTTGSSIPYAASKAALNHVTMLLANVLGPEIRVNAVAPGLVDTPWTQQPGWEGIHEVVKATAPLGRVGDPVDIADTVLGIVLSRYMTGAIIPVSGGLHLR